MTCAEILSPTCNNGYIYNEFSEKLLNSWCNVMREMPISGPKGVIITLFTPESVMLGISVCGNMSNLPTQNSVSAKKTHLLK